jgi:hypothetical protein
MNAVNRRKYETIGFVSVNSKSRREKQIYEILRLNDPKVPQVV